MNFNKIFEWMDDLSKIPNLIDIDKNDFKNFLHLINHFKSYEDYERFMILMKSIPTIEQVESLTHSNINLFFFELLETLGYFNLLDQTQKYHLFVEACSHDSVDIALLILSNDIDLIGVKELMLNYLSDVGTNTEYVIFRKIWEKNIIKFNQEEIKSMFISILKSLNIEFIEWYNSLNLVNLEDDDIKKYIGWNILEKSIDIEDLQIAHFICSLYLKNKKTKV